MVDKVIHLEVAGRTDFEHCYRDTAVPHCLLDMENWTLLIFVATVVCYDYIQVLISLFIN